MRNKTIGILAGMGPRSTAPFIDMLFDECQRQYGAKDDIDFPPILIYSLPTPFFVNQPIDHSLMQKIIRAGLIKLEKTGASFIAIPCNTAHLYYEEFCRSINVPLLNIISETIKMIPSGSMRVGLLATKRTIDSGIYQNYLKQRFTDIFVATDWQEQVNSLVTAIKTSNDSELFEQLWGDLQVLMESQKIETAIIACTELSKVYNPESTDMVILNTARILASSVIKKWLEYS